MITHSPGPWSLGRRGKSYVRINSARAVPNRWDAFCKVCVSVEGVPDAIGEANARLIASAPELLEALEELEALGGLGQTAHRIIRAAIAKARGEA